MIPLSKAFRIAYPDLNLQFAKMKWTGRYLKSFLRETVVERSSSPFNPRLEVVYTYGKHVLNATSVNYSYGLLDNAFRAAFSLLKIEDRPIQHVLILGLGAGNVATLLAEYNPDYDITGVEVDAEVIRLGKKYFQLGTIPRLQVVIGDALEYVAGCQEQYDLLVVDLFIDDKVPAATETSTFFQALAKLLAPGALLIWNRLAPSDDPHQQTEAFFRKMQTTLPGAWSFPAHRNRMICYEK